MLNNTIDKTVGIIQILTDKLSGINDKTKESILLSSEYEDLNNKLNTLSAMFISNSDIVSLLNLPRAISEYTNEHIGEIISIPYTDESGIISGPIEFEVVGVNHHKDINVETKPTITLMSKDVLRAVAFDAKEPTNPNEHIAEYGNNRWSVSNIRQWLNSEGAANEWFTAQHEYDEAPTGDKIQYNNAAYTNNHGFLAGFSQDIKSHFATVANTTWVYGTSTIDITNDKVFLASYTEIGYGNNRGIAEGTHLSIRYPDENSRIKKQNDFDNYYWLRSASFDNQSYVWHIDYFGTAPYVNAYKCDICIAPLIVLY